MKVVEDAALQIEQIYGFVSEEIKKALDVAGDALSKQIGKKLIGGKRDGELICPNCKGVFVNCVNHYPYCPMCGQKLDWSEEAEKSVANAYNTGHDVSEHWIPVSVLLPFKEGPYLVTVERDDFDEKKEIVGIFDWRDGEFQLYYVFDKARVTAWMPLPEPFEEEEE